MISVYKKIKFYKSLWRYLTICTVLLHLYSLGLFAQQSFSQIKGRVTDADFKYASIYMHEKKMLYKVDIVDHNFTFYIDKKNDFAILYLSNDATEKYEDIAKNNLERLTRTKLIALDSIVNVDIKKDMRGCKLTGGMYTTQLNEMEDALKTRRYDLFLKKHNDSRIAVILLEALARTAQIFNNLQEVKGYYNILSDKMKNSKEGLEVKYLLSAP